MKTSTCGTILTTANYLHFHYIPINPSLFPRVADSLGKRLPLSFEVELGAGSFDAVLVLNGEESREDLGVSVGILVSVDDLGLAEVELGVLLDEVGVELVGFVGFGVSLGEWELELELGFLAGDSGFLLETLV